MFTMSSILLNHCSVCNVSVCSCNSNSTNNSNRTISNVVNPKNKGGRPKEFPLCNDEEYRKFRQVDRHKKNYEKKQVNDSYKNRDQSGSYKRRLEKISTPGELASYKQKESIRVQKYQKLQREINENQKALNLKTQIISHGIMETIEDMVITTPDKRKRVIEFQTSKKSTPEEIATTTDYVNNLSPTTLNNTLYMFNSAKSKLKSSNQKFTKKKVAAIVKSSTEKTLKIINLNDENVENDIFNRAYVFIKKEIFNPLNVIELLQSNTKTLNVSGFDLFNKLAKSFGVDMCYERTTLQNQRSYLALGLFHELLSFGHQGFVIKPDYFVLPVMNVLKLIIKNVEH